MNTKNSFQAFPVYFILMVVLTFSSLPNSYGQSTTNAIVNFDFQFSDSEIIEFWKAGITDTFQFIDAAGKVQQCLTVDTMVTYAVMQLENFNQIDIVPVKLGTVKQKMQGKLSGFPDIRATDAAKSGEYAQMFDISVWVFSGGGNLRIGLPVEEKRDKVHMTITIKQYDRDATLIASYKKRTHMADLTKSVTAVFGFSSVINLTGNELFALFAMSLQNALVAGEKTRPERNK